MEKHTAEEWSKIIGEYMRDTNNVPDSTELSPEQADTAPETGGFYAYERGIRNKKGLYEQNSAETNTGISNSIPAPMENTFSSPVNYQNQNHNIASMPAQNVQSSQNNTQNDQNMSQSSSGELNASHFSTPTMPSTGIYNQNSNQITNTNQGQYMSNVNQNTIHNLNTPAEPRNVNLITDDGNIMCKDCVDCRNCFNCNHCVSCDRCTTCDACRVCDSCLDCVGSSNMYNCHKCNNCNSVRDSDNCTNCNNCHHIVDCANCSDLSYAIGYVKNKKMN